MLSFKEICVTFGKKMALDGVSFDLRPCRLTALVGRNGSGKSTLLNCVSGIVPYTGLAMMGERDLARLRGKERAKLVAVLPQNLPQNHLTGREVASLGRSPYLDFTGRLTGEDREAVKLALEDAGAAEFAERYADALSGGERQRLYLAMILAQSTPVILLDEPTAHQDLPYEAAFLARLRQLTRQRQKTVLVILHDLNQAVEYADDLVVLDKGRLVFAGSREECLKQAVLEKTFSLRRYSVCEEGTERFFFGAVPEEYIG